MLEGDTNKVHVECSPREIDECTNTLLFRSAYTIYGNRGNSSGRYGRGVENLGHINVKGLEHGNKAVGGINSKELTTVR